MVLLAALVEARTAAEEVVALLEEDWAMAPAAARTTMMLESCMLNMDVDEKVSDRILGRRDIKLLKDAICCGCQESTRTTRRHPYIHTCRPPHLLHHYSPSKKLPRASSSPHASPSNRTHPLFQMAPSQFGGDHP